MSSCPSERSPAEPGFLATPFARMGASMPPVGHMAGVMHRGFVAPLAHGVHADAILPGRYPAGATGLLQCLGGSVLVPCHQHGNALAGAGHVARTAGSSARPGAGGHGVICSQSSGSCTRQAREPQSFLRLSRFDAKGPSRHCPCIAAAAINCGPTAVTSSARAAVCSCTRAIGRLSAACSMGTTRSWGGVRSQGNGLWGAGQQKNL